MQSTRAGKAASSSMPAVTPGPSSARVKPEPGTASAAAAAGGPPSTGARPREPGSKSKRTGGSRDGYAVRQSVLDDDWEEELEDEAEDLSESLTDKLIADVGVTDLGTCAYDRLGSLLIAYVGVTDLGTCACDRLGSLLIAYVDLTDLGSLCMCFVSAE